MYTMNSTFRERAEELYLKKQQGQGFYIFVCEESTQSHAKICRAFLQTINPAFYEFGPAII